MDSKRYEAFVAAVDANSMSGAAKELGYTPSGIIRLINALEEEMGFALLARTSTGVTCTAEGEKLLPIFREMVELGAKAQATGARIRGLAEGTLTVGVPSSLAAKWMPPVLEAFQRRYPEVRVDLVEGSDARLLELLDRHEIDCCVFRGDHARLDWIPLGRQEIVAWLPAEWQLARLPSIILAELDGRPYARIHHEGLTRADRLLEERGLEMDTKFVVSEPYAAFRLVDKGLCCSLSYNGLIGDWKGKVAERPLSPRQFQDFGIGTLPAPSLSPAVEEFVAIAQQFRDRWPA